MAKVDSPDSLYLNPAGTGIKPGTKKERSRVGKGRSSRFSSALEAAGKTEAADGPFRDLPVSDETVDLLMNEVLGAGGELRKRPFPDEILRYKQAVRDFMHYVVENGFAVDRSEGIPNYLRPAYRGERGTPEALSRRPYISVRIVDKKLEDLAAALLSGQADQLELTARLEEITGLLVDLLQ
ncbi:MAG: YaaR family protein [Treponema sp.]|jgi:uncharacterized protein YaaR (DUF327 family)|nr:YaaR family protein [Treponema sp.]